MEFNEPYTRTRTRSLTRSQALNQQLKEHFLIHCLFAGYSVSRCYALFWFNYVGCWILCLRLVFSTSVTVSNSTESSEFRGLSRQQWNCSWLTESRERQYVVLLYVDIYRNRLHIVQMTLITLYLVPICVFAPVSLSFNAISELFLMHLKILYDIMLHNTNNNSNNNSDNNNFSRS